MPARWCCWSYWGFPRCSGVKLSETLIARCIYFAVMAGLGSSLVVLAAMLISGDRHVPIELGHWIKLPEQDFHFHLKFVFDRLSVPFVILTFLLCGTIGAFTTRYLHREAGFTRFYIAYALFMLGMILASLAGTIEVLFFGWELVGLVFGPVDCIFPRAPQPGQKRIHGLVCLPNCRRGVFGRGGFDASLDRCR